MSHACCNVDYLNLPDLIARRDLFGRLGTALTGMALATLLEEEARSSGAADSAHEKTDAPT
ncbi:MAG TPA: hypothetical protein VKU82_13805, partial [Planctomycetaceae bacterium]|nr:hypothetical protein [Planctomycetaceae bacterium]